MFAAWTVVHPPCGPPNQPPPPAACSWWSLSGSSTVSRTTCVGGFVERSAGRFQSCLMRILSPHHLEADDEDEDEEKEEEEGEAAAAEAEATEEAPALSSSRPRT